MIYIKALFGCSGAGTKLMRNGFAFIVNDYSASIMDCKPADSAAKFVEYDACPWFMYNFGLRENAAGQAYYDSILKDGGLVIWTALPESGNGIYVSIFNTGDSDLKIDRSWKDLEPTEASDPIRDLRKKKSRNSSVQLETKLSPHASAIWKLQ
jgi:hypothetical protein